MKDFIKLRYINISKSLIKPLQGLCLFQSSSFHHADEEEVCNIMKMAGNTMPNNG